MLKGGGDLVHLDQVVPRLGEGFEDRFHRAGQIGQGFGNGNQAVFAYVAAWLLILRENLLLLPVVGSPR